jgi:sugar lactone lactonase YvrE
MSGQDPAWRCVVDAGAGVGEVPTWEASTGRLYWLDPYGPTIDEIDPVSGARRSWVLPDMPGSYGLRPGGSGCVVATMSGIYDLDFAAGTVTMRYAAPYDQQNYRFNDGRCDPAGRLWFGTNRKPRSECADGTASFWRVDEDGPREQIRGITIANGIAFSPAGDLMYIADSPNDQILVFDYDTATGTAANRRTFATTQAGSFPDGAAVDRDGGYWVALFNGDRVVRFTADGVPDIEIPSPVPQPTMVSFGGPDLGTLFLTTARRFLTDQERASFPLSGGIFACELGVAGIPEPHVSRI